MKRVALDCNVLVSAGLTRGVCRRVLEHALQHDFIVVSPAIEKEYREVFQRPKFSGAYEQFEIILNEILTVAYMFETTSVQWTSPDPKDQPYLDVAITAQAD